MFLLLNYLNLITSEHRTKPKYINLLTGVFQPLVDTGNAFPNMSAMLSLEEASGDQLDIIGSYVGIGRTLPTSNTDIPSPLTDEYYKKVIKSKILENQWDGTIGGLKEIINEVFPDISVIIGDNQDMSYEIFLIYPEGEETEVALITEGFILPKPVGVGVEYTVIQTELFGWDLENEYISGWDNGTWKNI